MIPTLVIGLREGVEASLIVGIIAAFLNRNGRRDALRQMWLGVLAADGAPVIPMDAHVRLASPREQRWDTDPAPGLLVQRRDHPGPRELDAGLFFIAYQKDPQAQFVPSQRSLGTRDALNEYIQHVGSALLHARPAYPRAERTGPTGCWPDPCLDPCLDP